MLKTLSSLDVALYSILILFMTTYSSPKLKVSIIIMFLLVSGLDGTFGFSLTFGVGYGQILSCYSKEERDSWISAIQSASHNQIRQHLLQLKNKVRNLNFKWKRWSSAYCRCLTWERARHQVKMILKKMYLLIQTRLP